MSAAPVPNNAAWDAAAEAAPPAARGMTKVDSMLFDCEVDEHGSVPENQQSLQAVEDGLVEDLVHLTKPRTPPDTEVFEVVRRLASTVGIKELSLEDLARRLMSLLPAGSEVKLRSANPACVGQGAGDSLRNLRHTFIVCRVEGMEYVVDPSFKEQFSIVHPTAAFQRLMAALPPVVVLPAERVAAVVELLCRAMSAAFKAANKEIPPWRRADAMLSKWRPRRSCDVTQTAADTPADGSGGVSDDDAPPPSDDDSGLEDSAHNMYKVVSKAHATFGLPGVRALARPPTAPQSRTKQSPMANSAKQRPKSSPPSRLSEELARSSDKYSAANTESAQAAQGTTLVSAYHTVSDAISDSFRRFPGYGRAEKLDRRDGLHCAGITKTLGRHLI